MTHPDPILASGDDGTPPHVTDTLARFVLSPSAAIPPSAEQAARRTIANSLGLVVGGSHHPAHEIARQVLTLPGSVAQATVLGCGDRVSMPVAALLGGMAAHVEDFDDTHLQTVIHPGAPIVPAALAVAEHRDAVLGELVDAVVFGVEAALRVGIGICPGHFDRGWHLTSTTGRFGATAAAARLLGLTADQVVSALGIAATEAAGLQAALGTMTKSWHPGKAAADGIEAALLASYGMTGPARPIEGRRGFAQTAAPSQDYEAMLAGLGQDWEIERNTFKPYACGIVSHPVLDAGILMRSKVLATDIATVVVRTHPVVLDVMGVEEPTDGLHSKFSVYHCFAVGFLEGAGGPAQFSDETARRPQIVALRRKVRVELDPAIAKDECFATVRTLDGATHDVHIEHATGSLARPMTDSQLLDKASLVAAPVIGAQAARRLADLVLHAPRQTPVRELVSMTLPPAAA